jgi:hypothetical protein
MAANWNATQICFMAEPPTSSSVWYNASFDSDGNVYIHPEGTSPVPLTGANASILIDAIGSGPDSGGGDSGGSGGYTPSPSPSPDSDIDWSSLYLGRDFGNSANSNREVTDLVGEGRGTTYNIPGWQYQDNGSCVEGTWVRSDGYTESKSKYEERLKREAEEERAKEKQTAPYNPPVEIGTWRLHFGLSSSYDEYRYKALRRLTGEDAYGRLWSTTARVHAVKERLILSGSLSYEEYWGTGLMDRADYSALSLEFVPQYYLLRQDVEFIDLAAFLSLGGEHTWFDDSRLRDDQLDVWHYGGGLGAGRTFWFGDFWFAYLYQCHKNADGDDGVTGDGELGTHRLGVTYTALLTKQIPLQASIYYNHYSQLPKELDSDDFEGAVRVGWRSENWSLLLGYRQLFDSSDFRNWGVDCKFTYLW